MLFPVAAGVLVRCVIFATGLDESLSSRPELVTPLTAPKRLAEGAFLLDAGFSAYGGDQFHRPPLVLSAYRALIGSTSGVLPARLVLAALFMLADVLCALALRSLASILTRAEAVEALKEKRAPELKPATTCLPSETIRELQFRLIESPTGFVAVLDRSGGNMIGLVTLHDLLRAEVSITKEGADEP